MKLNSFTSQEAILQVAACLKQGGTVVLPTDTVIGLAASPNHSSAIDTLYALKARPRRKNLPIMVADMAQARQIGAHLSPQAAHLASEFMPGPLTLVLPLDTENVPNWLQGRTEIAVRIPHSPPLLEVLRHTGPLMVTSANLSGADTPDYSLDAAQQLTSRPDICIEGHSTSALPSTLINCVGETLTIERIGAVTEAQITATLEAL